MHFYAYNGCIFSLSLNLTKKKIVSTSMETRTFSPRKKILSILKLIFFQFWFFIKKVFHDIAYMLMWVHFNNNRHYCTKCIVMKRYTDTDTTKKQTHNMRKANKNEAVKTSVLNEPNSNISPIVYVTVSRISSSPKPFPGSAKANNCFEIRND